MPYIHELGDWPQFHWNEAELASLLVDVRNRQGRLLGHMEALGFRLQGEAHLANLTVDIVKSSAIEGELLDPRQVRSSLARKLGIETGGIAQVSRHVEGVVEMMLNATQKNNEPLTQDRLFAWHSALFPTGRSGMRLITVGAWRTAETGPMQVVSGGVGREKVHFEAPDSSRLEVEMNVFLKWFNASSRLDPVMKAALAHLWFVTFHPFEDGNGRIARAIADMLLARSDGTVNRFYSMSAQIEVERKDYYDVLESTQKGTLDITSWIRWFLECLGRALDRAQGALTGVMRKARTWEALSQETVNQRQREVLNRLLDGFEGNLTTSKYAKLAHCSNDTALRDIQGLLQCGALVQNQSGGRSTSYRLRTVDSLSPHT